MESSIINKFHPKEEKCLETLIVNWILAWSLLCDCCAKLIEYIKDIILSDHFITLHIISLTYADFILIVVYIHSYDIIVWNLAS